MKIPVDRVMIPATIKERNSVESADHALARE
jgi:hypothetical protein